MHVKIPNNNELQVLAFLKGMTNDKIPGYDGLLHKCCLFVFVFFFVYLFSGLISVTLVSDQLIMLMLLRKYPVF